MPIHHPSLWHACVSVSNGAVKTPSPDRADLPGYIEGRLSYSAQNEAISRFACVLNLIGEEKGRDEARTFHAPSAVANAERDDKDGKMSIRRWHTMTGEAAR